MNTWTHQNWRLARDEHDILWLTLDKVGVSTNVLSKEVMGEFNAILDGLATERCKGLVIESAKKNGFIAGANIEEFQHIKTEEAARDAALLGQGIFRKLAALPFPTLALIHGFCLGGGLELSLGCRYRIAEDSETTRLGLPEAMLGLNPGWTGVVHLPRLVGVLEAMRMMLSGTPVSAKVAEKIGLVDVAVPIRHLKRAAVQTLLTLPKPKRLSFFVRLLDHSLLRPLVAKLLYKQVKDKADPTHYPAPYAMIEDWKQYGVHQDTVYAKTAETFGRLFVTETSRNLIRVFHLQERLKGLSKGTGFKANWVHVVGAGIMGGDIAAWCAMQGLTVTLQDREPKYVANAIKRAYDLFKKKLKKPRAIQEAMDRLIPDIKQDGVAKADIVIEAIFENLHAKQELFKYLEQHAKPDAILATNTSSILLKDIAQVLKQPGRLVGIHFFNPVSKMPLVEVVRDKLTKPEVVAASIAFVRQISRFPLPVKSSPGFLVNRTLMPYLMEGVSLLEEGKSAEAIDQSIRAFGMPLGPVELADMVGLEVCLEVAKNLSQILGGPVPKGLQDLVSKGHFGVKTGKGFYTYKRGKALRKPIASITPSKEIIDRLMLRMVNESLACLREGIVEDADLLDAGMIFGTGFAPFRGGPLQYLKTIGTSNFEHTMKELQKQHGERFRLGQSSRTSFIT